MITTCIKDSYWRADIWSPKLSKTLCNQADGHMWLIKMSLIEYGYYKLTITGILHDIKWNLEVLAEKNNKEKTWCHIALLLFLVKGKRQLFLLLCYWCRWMTPQGRMKLLLDLHWPIHTSITVKLAIDRLISVCWKCQTPSVSSKSLQVLSDLLQLFNRCNRSFLSVSVKTQMFLADGKVLCVVPKTVTYICLTILNQIWMKLVALMQFFVCKNSIETNEAWSKPNALKWYSWNKAVIFIAITLPYVTV